MKLTAHFHRWEIAYRAMCGVLSIGFLLGYFWGTHEIWELGPTAAFGLGAIAPRKAIPALGIVFVLLLAPTIAKLIERVSYLWKVPYPQVIDMGFEFIATLVMLWTLVAAGCLVFASRENAPNVT